MSAKQRTIVLAAILLIILLVAALLIYSITKVHDYDGIFVSGIRKVWY